MVFDFKDCPHCGWSELESSNFCRRCGKPMNNKLKSRINCHYCGKPIKNYSKFCEHCGSEIARNLNYCIRFSNIKKCPNCNNMNNIDSLTCSNCSNKLPIVTELNIINCPDCNNEIRDDVNYCRFCGHDFSGYKNEPTQKFKLISRKIKSGTNLLTADNKIHCENCGQAIYGPDADFCIKCSSPVPKRDGLYLDRVMNYEKFNLELANKFIVPISKDYKVNFRKTTLKDYFNLTKEQELRIIYVMMEKLKKNDTEDAVKLFKTTLKQTKDNFENIEETIFNLVKQELINRFNSNGISVSDVTTVKNSHYDTIETPIVQNKHGGLTKGVATLGFGIIGFAATSGIKTTTETKQVFRSGEYLHSQITFNNRSIVLKSYTNDSSSKIFNSKPGINQIAIKYDDIHSFNSENFTFFLESGENFGCPPIALKYIVRQNIKKITTTYDKSINDQFIQNYTNKINKKIKLIIAELINEQITLAKKSNSNQHQSNVDISGLEKIAEMYEKDLLTDEEFINLKQKIIGNEINTVNEETADNYTNNTLKTQVYSNDNIEITDDNKSYVEFTPSMIRETFSDINQQFIDKGKIPNVEEILNQAGVDYIIIEKNQLYRINQKI